MAGAFFVDSELVSSMAELVETMGNAEEMMGTVRSVTILTVVMSSIVILSNVLAILLLIVEHHRTKRPKNVGERYKHYKTTAAKVISVEKVAYYIKKFVRKSSSEELDSVGNKKKDDVTNPLIDKDAPSHVEKSTADEVILKSPEQLAKEQSESHEEIRKIRYRVFYEFTVADTGNLYTGECYVYDADAVNPGDIIEVTYNPDDPMNNFTDYNMPVGYLVK